MKTPPDDGTAPAGDPPADPAGDAGSDGDRITRIENKVDRLTDVVSKLLPGSHADAQQRTEARLDRPSSVQEQVRAELARAKSAQQAADAADAEKTERQQMREQLARLAETPPRPPVPWRTRILGWGD